MSVNTQNPRIRPFDQNPLVMLERGIQPPTMLARHKRGAAVGNLYYEYAQNVQILRGVVRSGSDIAEYLAAKDLIVLDRDNGRYIWKGEPWPRSYRRPPCSVDSVGRDSLRGGDLGRSGTSTALRTA